MNKVFIIGTSLGGLVAMGINMLIPRTVAGVLLNDIGPELANEGIQSLQIYLSKSREFDNWDQAACYLKGHFPYLGENSHRNWIGIVKGSYKIGQNGKIIQNWDPRIYKAAKRVKLDDLNLWPIFRALRKTPLLLLRGEKSNILDENVFNKMREQNDDMRAAVIPDAGHAPTLLEPVSKKYFLDIINEVDSTYAERY